MVMVMLIMVMVNDEVVVGSRSCTDVGGVLLDTQI